MKISKTLVVKSQTIQQGRLEIVHVDPIAHCAATEIVRLAMGISRAGAAAGHPDGESLRLVIAAGAVAAFVVDPELANELRAWRRLRHPR